MTGAEVIGFFSPVLPNLGAPEFACPTLAWLIGPLFEAMQKEEWAFNLEKPRGGNVCRHFARRACVFAQDAWANSPNFDPALPDLAVFEFWFHPDATRGMQNPLDDHALVASFTDAGFVAIDYMNLTAASRPWQWTLSHDEFLSRRFVR